MKKPNNLTTVALPWGQNAELEFTSPAVALTLVPLAEGESPRAEATPDVPLEVKESGKLTRVTATPVFERFGFWRSMPRVWLHLPRDVRARVTTDAGTVWAEGFSGCALQLSTSAGVIDLSDVHGQLVLRSSANLIRGVRVGGTLDVETNAGAIKLDVDSLEAGTHRIRSSMGPVKVHLAPGLDVRLEPQTTLGSVRTRYPSRPEAAAVLRLETELGSVRVRESGHEPGEEREEYGESSYPGMAGPWMRMWGMRGFGRHGGRGHPMHGGRHFHETPPPPASPARSATAGVADEELRRILTLVQEQRLTAEQAEQLLRAMDGR
jgi:hypothetical protein